ncbi:membrane fusion protein (multidrug efflux system) [Novosphingobium sp. PhB165]|uniref:HlyD family secretion protein n=1 Tax=Novosphingobium sp. PhB165 TaxID=2485105 RepID=UPI001053224F|nr:HlyD family secretion protein [Novosphingobium sp. PhB165]TCM22327.1 membrane fusion protein (multidrug efflux system) [Novosphingobium sp. PhB165]
MNAETSIVAEDEGVSVPSARRKPLRAVLMLAGPLIVLTGAGWFYLSGGRYEETDNAALQTGMVAISPNVAGTVVDIAVRENEHVRKGQVLFRIRPTNFTAAVDSAEAELAKAQTDAASRRADYQEALTQVSAAQARHDFAMGEASRQKSLTGEGISSRAQYEQASTEARTALQAIAAAEARAESLRAGLAGHVEGDTSALPDVRKAAAKLAQARIDLADTEVRAPQDGIVTRVNQLQVGNYVSPGRAVFMLTGLNFWVQANFKEDQLRYMRAGQPATVTLDAFPDHAFKAHVQSFSPGTGSSFSVLPAENATGNWVKVVQRLPVQVTLDEPAGNLPLGAGLSASVKVDTGHERHLFAADTSSNSAARKP